MTRKILDLKEGIYAVELHTMVEQGIYLHSFEVKVVPERKHNLCGTETVANPVAAPSSAVYTRALRLGLNTRAAA